MGNEGTERREASGASFKKPTAAGISNLHRDVYRPAGCDEMLQESLPHGYFTKVGTGSKIDYSIELLNDSQEEDGFRPVPKKLTP